MKRTGLTFQWMQLLALSSVHFLADMFANMLPSLLPALREQFTLSLSLGGLALTALVLISNGTQILSGHMRPHKTTPLFMHLGLVLAVAICLLALLPRSPGAYPAIIALALVSGAGVGVTHPEGLRGIHCLDKVSPATSTAVFMAGGFFGYAAGGIISTALVSKFGFQGLYVLILCPVIAMAAIALLRVRLAVEPEPGQANNHTETRLRLPFRSIMVLAVPAAVSTTILASLLPTALAEIGFHLTFGGFSVTMFGTGGAVGCLAWAAMARQKGELRCSVFALFLILPFLVAYLALMHSKLAVVLLLGAGFSTFAAYILLITLARNAVGLKLGQRMAWIVGGSWAISYIIFLPLLQVAERWGTPFVLTFCPLGYLISGLLGLKLIRKTQTSANRSDTGL